MKTDIFSEIGRKRLVPVATVSGADQGVRVAEALLAGGLNVIEVTLRTEGAEDALAAIAKKFPDMILGAGTVLDAEKIPLLVDMGVHFAVSPGLNPRVVEAAHSAGLPITPGVMTPGEVERGRELGCPVLKFFPAEPAGGAAMLKALGGPYGHTGLKFIPTGGISVRSAPDYWALKTVLAVGGSWFVAQPLVDSGDYAAITRLTREAVAGVE